MPNIYGAGAGYGPDSVQGGRLVTGYPYSPLSLLLALPAYVALGDYRYTNVLAIAASGLLILRRRTPISLAAGVLLLFNPRILFFFEQGWNDALVVLALTFMLLFFQSPTLARGAAFGVLLAIKQYTLIYATLLPLLRERRSRKSLGTVAVMAVLTAALLYSFPTILDLKAAWRSMYGLHLGIEPRIDSLSLGPLACQKGTSRGSLSRRCQRCLGRSGSFRQASLLRTEPGRIDRPLDGSLLRTEYPPGVSELLPGGTSRDVLDGNIGRGKRSRPQEDNIERASQRPAEPPMTTIPNEPMAYDALRLKHFRAFREVALPVRGLNVLIGPNGCGKSSLLEVFRLLGRGMKGELGKGIREMGGFREQLPFRGRDFQEVSLAIGLSGNIGELRYDYSLELQLEGVGYQVVHETLASKTADDPGDAAPRIEQHRGKVGVWTDGTQSNPWWNQPPGELVLGRAPLPDVEQFREPLDRCQLYHQVDMSPTAAIRNPQDLDPAPFVPGPQGVDLLAALYNIKTEDPASYERILDALRAGFPDFKEIDFPTVAAGKVSLVWKEQPGRRFYAHRLSEGTLRFLWLATLLLSPRIPPLVLIDEPEISLHPELLKLLAGMLQDAALRSRVFVATHSPQLIRWLEPHEIVVLDKEEGVSTARRGDDPSLNLESWLEEYTLDELWVLGEMGGRP